MGIAGDNVGGKLKVLIVATNHTDPLVTEQVRAGKHHRLDYMELAARFRSEYIDYSVVKHNSVMRWLEEKLRMDLRQALHVARVVREKKYNVVFSLSERVGIPLSHLLSRRVKHVVHFHHPLSPKLGFLKALRIPERWDQMIVLTRATAQVLQKQLGLGSDRIVMLNSPIDTRFYQPSVGNRAIPEQDHVFSLGLSHRDYPTLIRAMRELPHIICYFGVGSAWVQSHAGFDHQAIPSNVRVQPFVHPSILRDRYAASRFVIVPIQRTRLWSAGCTTVTQAQAMGKAVIATHNPGMPDYVLHGETGLLVEQSDPESMADAIARLWNDSDLRTRMGARAREWAATRFSLDQWLDAVTQLVHTLN